MSAREELSDALRSFWSGKKDLRKSLEGAAGNKHQPGSFGECLYKAADTTPARRAGKQCAESKDIATKYSSVWG